MEEHYRYKKYPDGTPYTTICILKDNEHTYVGIAICSEGDKFCKKTGRALAKRRAIKAFYSLRDQLPIQNTNCFPVYKTLKNLVQLDKPFKSYAIKTEGDLCT